MNRIFNMDNKFFTFMSRVADLIILNIAFLICCIPIVTIGASITSMYYVTLKMARNEESYILRSFFKSFKQNFKQSTIIWLILLAAGLLLGIDFQIVRQIDTNTFIKVISYCLYIIVLVYAMVISYVFALIARFENSVKNTLKNSLLMSLRHLPFTFLILIVTFVPLVLTLTIPIVLIYGLIVWIMVGFALIAYIDSLMLVRIFDQYMPKEEEENPELDDAAERL